jgi:hypothetical protein
MVNEGLGAFTNLSESDLNEMINLNYIYPFSIAASSERETIYDSDEVLRVIDYVDIPISPNAQYVENEQALLRKKPAFEVIDQNRPLKAYEILASKTYCQSDDQCKTIMTDYEKIYRDKEIRPIIDLAAMRILDNQGFYIAILNEANTLNFSGIDAGAFYNYKNVVIGNGHNNNDWIKGAIAHELNHSIMDYLFNNRCKPYRESQTDRINAMEQTNKQVLTNIAHLKELPASFNVGNYSESYQLGSNLMSVYENSGYKLNIEGHQHDWLRRDYDEISSCVFEVYNQTYYPSKEHSEDVETIVRYHQLKLERITETALKILEPYRDYWGKFIYPEIENKIKNHAKSYLLERTNIADIAAAPVPVAGNNEEILEYNV